MGLVINTTVISDATYGNITAGGNNDNISASTVTVNVNASGVTSLTPGLPIFIVSAGSGSSGATVNVTSNNSLYSFIGSNLNGNITITPTLNPVIPLPPGAGSVFTALLAIAAANPGSDIAAVVAALTALPTPAAIASALAQLNPNVNGAIPLMSFNAMKQFTNVWSKQMGYGRCVYATDCEDECCYREVRRKPKQKECCETGCSTEINCENVCNTFEVWGDVFGYFGHQNRRDGFRGYDSQIYGGMVGFQAPLSQTSSVGLGGGYANTQIHERNKGSIQTYDLTAYYSYDATNFFADAAFSFDVNRYKSSRKIDFPGIDRTANAHYYGQEYTGLVDAGYRYYTSWCGVITPFASLMYSYLHVNGYHEHGASSLDLHEKHQNYNFLESGLGLKLSQIIQTSNGVFVPEIHGIWLHDFFRDRMDLTSTFSGVAEEAGSFETEGPSQDRNWGDVGTGITFITCSNLAFELVYNYQFGKTYHSQEGLLKITQRF
ncbi:MAG TPA: autotransporter outer membrane beta-barrel domain-containing protein [Rhabdochlamydiaceae bacterium]|nr:autotransporter outer membrane beta-barrel domain-containing protein [Rhabdochlamydiaceae bacterium]